jgi:hypothetical protein
MWYEMPSGVGRGRILQSLSWVLSRFVIWLGLRTYWCGALLERYGSGRLRS